MKNFWKYIVVVLVLAVAGYVVYHYRQEILSLLETCRDKAAGLKARLCPACAEQDEFEDL